MCVCCSAEPHALQTGGGWGRGGVESATIINVVYNFRALSPVRWISD